MEGGTRRQFLRKAGAAGLTAGAAAAALGEGTAQAATAGRARTSAGGDAVGFYGSHQAGIATPTQEHIQFVSLDFASDSAGDLRALLALLSQAAAKLTAGRRVGALETGVNPPVDTGEAVGLGASRLTITFGLGPALFRHGRLGLAHRRPAPLVKLPSFRGDALRRSISGGDIALQVCADDPQVAFHAAHDLIRLASPTAIPRWTLAGFGRTLNTRHHATPRNLFGFKDGTANIMSEDHDALERFVWARGPESPAWMHGGSYMVVRRIAMSLGNWDSIGLEQQQQTFGRMKLSGAPIGERSEYAPLDLSARSGGQLKIPANSHVRLASPKYNHGERILRRGYSYVQGVDAAQDDLGGGQLFVCFQRDPRRQFIPIQRRLAGGDALLQHVRHIGSAIFACPPGARHGSFVGAGLFR